MFEPLWLSLLSHNALEGLSMATFSFQRYSCVKTFERHGTDSLGGVALTVIFGPIGLIKHGKNVEIPAGTPLVVFVQKDIWLPPMK
jgi:hypothetical protein